MAGIEPATYPLRRDCSTIELHRRARREYIYDFAQTYFIKDS